MRHFTQFFNASVDEERLSAEWLKSTVITRHKGGEYRTGNMVFIELNPWKSFARRNNLKANVLTVVEQHGFGHRRWCLNNLNSVLGKVTGGIDEGERLAVCYPCFQVAFEFVNRRPLDHVGPPGNQMSMKQIQQARDLGILRTVDFKPNLQLKKRSKSYGVPYVNSGLQGL